MRGRDREEGADAGNSCVLNMRSQLIKEGLKLTLQKKIASSPLEEHSPEDMSSSSFGASEQYIRRG